MEYLKHDEYVPIGEDLEIGEQIHINHEDCPAGHDTKKRLYIRRGDDDGNDVIMAYCHHCNKRGSYWKPYSKVLATKPRNGSSKRSNGNPLPSDCTGVWDEWDIRGRLWLTHGGIDECTSRKYGIMYSPSEGRVILPVKNYASGTLMGYQMRALHGEEPKYLTNIIKKPMFWYSGTVSNTLVIVEDILSAIRCSKFHSSLALLSGGMSDEVYALIGKSKFTNFIVYLDNDNSQIKRSQLSIARRLRLLGNVTIIKSDKDPKELSDKELEDEIRST